MQFQTIWGQNMNVEVSATPRAIHYKPVRSPKHVGTKLRALKNQVKIGVADLEVVTITDWTALRQEIHQKLQELTPSNGCWQRAKSDFETKIAALEESIRLLTPSPVNTLVRRWHAGPESKRSLCLAEGSRVMTLRTQNGARQSSVRQCA